MENKVLEKPMMCDFFEIYTDRAGRHIIIHSCTYKTESDWHWVDGEHLTEPLQKFIQSYAEQGELYVIEAWEISDVYDSPMSEEEMLKRQNELIHSGVEGIRYEDITMDTPDGRYFSIL